jgi:hypothetical protein
MPRCTSQDPAQLEEPRAYCQTKDGRNYWRVIAADAKIILDKFGIDPCDLPGKDRISRQDALEYVKTVVF